MGKEGQIKYSVYSKEMYVSPDSLITIPLLGIGIEIDQGQRLLDKITDWGKLEANVRSTITGFPVVWKIYKTESGWFVGYVALSRIWIDVSAQNIQQIDTLITIAKTLTGS